MQGWAGVGHAGVSGSNKVGWVMQGWAVVDHAGVGWIIQGCSGSYRGRVRGHTGWGESCSGGLGWVMQGSVD